MTRTSRAHNCRYLLPANLRLVSANLGDKVTMVKIFLGDTTPSRSYRDYRPVCRMGQMRVAGDRLRVTVVATEP